MNGIKNIESPSDWELRKILDDGVLPFTPGGTLIRLLAFCVAADATSLDSKTTRAFANAAEDELNRRFPYNVE